MKAAQSGGNAAVLVLVIGAFIILYLLFLPPEERSDLLNEKQPGISTPESRVQDIAEANAEVVLDEAPGLLVDQRQQRFEHKIPSFNLFSRTQDLVLKEVQAVSIFAKRGEQKSKVVPLVLDKPTSNVQLSFTAADHQGRLTILLNEQEIFSGTVSGQPEPIALENLKDENVIEFRAEPVDWQFWRTNFYDLTGIAITGTVQDLSNQESSASFIISKEEFERLESAQLIYFVDCTPAKVEKLTVYLNDRILSSRVPDCGSPVKSELDPRDLIEGKNELRFFAQAGSYLLDQIIVKTDLEEPILPIYFFEVNESQFSLLQNESAEFDAQLTMHFVSDGERKAAELSINNFRLFVDTHSSQYNRTISSFIIEDSNFIRIEPVNTFSLVDLEIELE